MLPTTCFCFCFFSIACSKHNLSFQPGTPTIFLDTLFIYNHDSLIACSVYSFQVLFSLVLLFESVLTAPPRYTAAYFEIPGVGILRDELIQHYYTIGYTAIEIIVLLLSRHNVNLSLRQLRRIIRRLGIRRRDNQHSANDVLTALRSELRGSGQNLGYRAMWRRLKTRYNIQISQEIVRQLLLELDPEGVAARLRHRLRRRQYVSKGPNYLVHVDGYDKLKPFGFAVHGAIDGFSRKILWLNVGFTNNDPRFIAQFYLNYVQNINGVPCIVRADRGTENSIIHDIQHALRIDHNDSLQHASFMYGRSTSNQRIERWWRHLTDCSVSFWKQLFKDLREIGEFDNSDPVHVETLRFCFTGLIQRDFDLVVQEWNQHSIRCQHKEESPYGKPDLMYYLPEFYDCEEQKMPLLHSRQDIAEVERSFCREYPPFGCCPEFIDVLNGFVGNVNNLALPENVQDAVELYEILIDLLA